MAQPPSDLAQRRRRWLLALALAVLIHLLVLGWAPRPQPVVDRPHVLHPLIYSAAPSAPAPANPRPAPGRPKAISALPPPAAPPAPTAPTAEAPPPVPPPAAPPEPAPEPPAAATAQAQAEAPPPAPTQAPAPEPTAVQLPSSQRLRYKLYGELSRLPYHASGELLWRHDGQRYEARMEIGAFLLGSRVQDSRGLLGSAGLQPQRFVDRVRKDRVVEFDPDRSQIRFSEGAPALPWADEAQDQLSAFIQLAVWLGSAPAAYPPGAELTLTVVGIHGAQSWRFTVGADETLELPGGALRARRLSRAPASADEPRAEVWLAPSLGWLPARIRLSQDNGDFIDQQWSGSEPP